jgi:hypothetical protein
MLNVIKSSVIVLSVAFYCYTELRYAKWHQVECRCAEGRYAEGCNAERRFT